MPPTQAVMVDQLVARGLIRSARIAEAMRKVDRGNFLPPGDTYVDRPIKIGYNSTISSPTTHAQALSELEPYLKEGNSALDIGCGSGYLTLCFAILVGPKGSSRGVDHISELVENATASIISAGYEEMLSAELRLSAEDGRGALSTTRRYHAIYCGAAAEESVCEGIANNALAAGGKLLITVDYGETMSQVLRAYVKDSSGNVSFTDLKPAISNIVELNFPSHIPERNRSQLLMDAEAQRRGELSVMCSVM
jgi:protein-L-isoaspartate(D-aspartate) O-methyltransferase